MSRINVGVRSSACRHFSIEVMRSIARVNDIRKSSDLRVGRLIVIPRSSADPGRRPAGGGPGAPDHDEGTRFIDLRLMLSPAVEIEGASGEEVAP